MAEGTAKVLVVADSDEESVRGRLDELADGRELELKIIAPIKPKHGFELFTGDIDDSIAAADGRAESTAEAAEQGGGTGVAEARSADVDPMLAIEDALAIFKAERIVLVDAEDEFVSEVDKHFTIPVTAITSG